MNILVTINAHYMTPLKVMLHSLFVNNPGEHFSIYLLHASLNEEELTDLRRYVKNYGHRLKEIKVDHAYFEDAPTLKHFTTEMYYRLLAYKFLPNDVRHILYIDPDILVLNPVRELYNMNLEGYLYAAAPHSMINIKEINKIRLNANDIEKYYNSGVLLMNVALQKEWIDERSIFNYVAENRKRLMLPDQDILNALYPTKIKSISEEIFNYDARNYVYYKLKSNGLYDVDYVIYNTVFLHFCGKNKPWLKNYRGKFHSLYKHYEKQALQTH